MLNDWMYHVAVLQPLGHDDHQQNEQCRRQRQNADEHERDRRVVRLAAAVPHDEQLRCRRGDGEHREEQPRLLRPHRLQRRQGDGGRAGEHERVVRPRERRKAGTATPNAGSGCSDRRHHLLPYSASAAARSASVIQ